MRIMGIDPGYAILGYGIVEMKGNRFSPVEYGSITTDKDMEMPDRLKHLYSELMDVIDRCQPEVCSIEELFFNTNTTTAILVGQARGVAILACANCGVPISEYTPMQIKQALTGYGKAEKKQMQMMVKAILGLDEVPKPDDTADALAAAICHGHSAQAAARIRQYGQGSVKNLAKIREAQKTKNRWEQLIEEYEKGEKK